MRLRRTERPVYRKIFTKKIIIKKSFDGIGFIWFSNSNVWRRAGVTKSYDSPNSPKLCVFVSLHCFSLSLSYLLVLSNDVIRMNVFKCWRRATTTTRIDWQTIPLLYLVSSFRSVHPGILFIGAIKIIPFNERRTHHVHWCACLSQRATTTLN